MLATRIDALRTGWIVFAVGTGGAGFEVAVENIIGAEIEAGQSAAGGDVSQVPGRVSVEAHGTGGIGLTGVYRGPGGGQDDGITGMGIEKRLERLGRLQIHDAFEPPGTAARRNVDGPTRRSAPLKGPAQKSAATDQCHAVVRRPSSLRGLATLAIRRSTRMAHDERAAVRLRRPASRASANFDGSFTPAMAK